MARMAQMTSADRARQRTWKAYGEAVRRLEAALPHDATTTEPFEQIAERVIAACAGMGYGAWQELDERSGYRDLPGRFHWIRQTRNSATFGPRLLPAINKRVTGRAYSG